jgi:hypothetical protein
MNSTRVVWVGGIPYEVRPLYVLADGHPAKALLDLVIGYLKESPHHIPDPTPMVTKAYLVNCRVEPSISLDAQERDELRITAEFRLVAKEGKWPR